METVSLFIVHAPEDAGPAREIAAFLERGARVSTTLEEGRLRPGESLINKTAEGLSCDAVLVLLSAASSPARWPLDQWRPVFFDQPVESGVALACVQVDSCSFPDLLRRRKFFSLTGDQLRALRSIKEWVRELRTLTPQPFFAPERLALEQDVSAALERMRQQLGDRAGTLAIEDDPIALAAEFAHWARQDFDAVLWVNCAECSLAQMAGDLAAQLGLRLTGELQENCERLRDALHAHRCLLVLDDVDDERETAATAFAPGESRTSTLLVRPPRLDAPPSLTASLTACLTAGESHLVEAMRACAAGRFRLSLAVETANLEAEHIAQSVAALRDRALVWEIDRQRARYRLNPSYRNCAAAPLARRHAFAVRNHLKRGERADEFLPDLNKAIAWTLGQSDDPDVWALTQELVRRCLRALQDAGRAAESYELLQRFWPVAERLGDRKLLDGYAAEFIWILEGWDRHEEARRWQRERLQKYSDQLAFDF